MERVVLQTQPLYSANKRERSQFVDVLTPTNLPRHEDGECKNYTGIYCEVRGGMALRARSRREHWHGIGWRFVMNCKSAAVDRHPEVHRRPDVGDGWWVARETTRRVARSPARLVRFHAAMSHYFVSVLSQPVQSVQRQVGSAGGHHFATWSRT